MHGNCDADYATNNGTDYLSAEGGGERGKVKE